VKKFLIILPAVILISACTQKTNVIGKSGIDYSKYQQSQDVFTGVSAAPAADQSDIDDFVGSSRYNTKSSYGDAVVTVGSKKFFIGKTAGDKEMRAFQTSIDNAYRTAKKTYNPAGFTYSMSPAGAINPMSDMEVQCILSQDSADNIGQQTCDLFFKSLKTEYATATNTNAAL